MSFLIGFAVGFIAGWIVLNRPQVVTDFFAWVKGKFGWQG
jgi:hypothetical protein